MSLPILKTFGAFMLALTPALASAADLPLRTAPPLFTAVPVANWQGFYAGSFFAGTQAHYQASQIASRGVTKTGHTTGMLAGYNFQSGGLVYGLEGDLGMNFLRTDNGGVSGGLVAHSAESLYSAHLRGRIGYDLGAFMPFVAGGLMYNESYVRVSSGLDAKGAVQDKIGWTLGAGLDWKVPLPIVGETILRAEYLYEGIPSSTYRYDPALAPVQMKSGVQYLRAALIYTPSLQGWRAPPMEIADWAGAYAGVLAGYGNASAQTRAAAGTQKLSADGALGGLYAGRNFTFGRLVAGWEGSSVLTAWNGEGIVPGTLDRQSYRNYFESDLRARAGYAFGRFLPFVAAGASWGRSEQSDRASLSHKGRVSSNAWTVGGGVDYMIAERVSARLEYLHHKTWKDSDLDLNGASMQQSRSADLVRAGLAWHFH